MNAKVLMFGWEFPPQFSGGLGVACYGLSRALAAACADITLVLPSEMPVADMHVRVRFANIKTIKTTTLGFSESYAKPESRSFTHLGRARTPQGGSLLERVHLYGIAARAIAQEESFDIIHAHDWLTIPAALEAKRASGKPLIVHIHATEFDRSGGSGVNEDVHAIEKAGMAAADMVVAVSRYTKDIIEREYGISSDKITVVHNGIDGDHLSVMADISGNARVSPLMSLQRLKREGAKFVLFAGRITLQKGPDYFVELARRVLLMRPRTYFLMIGTGDMRDQIVDQAARAGLSSHFFLHGYYTHAELQALLDLSDLFVFPSVSEPFGLVPLEAAQRGTPIVLSKQTGVSEVFRNALMVDFWDVDEMVNKTVTLLDNPALAETLRENGKSEVISLDWRRAGAMVCSLYGSLMKKIINTERPAARIL